MILSIELKSVLSLWQHLDVFNAQPSRHVRSKGDQACSRGFSVTWDPRLDTQELSLRMHYCQKRRPKKQSEQTKNEPNVTMNALQRLGKWIQDTFRFRRRYVLAITLAEKTTAFSLYHTSLPHQFLKSPCRPSWYLPPRLHAPAHTCRVALKIMGNDILVWKKTVQIKSTYLSFHFNTNR